MTKQSAPTLTLAGLALALSAPGFFGCAGSPTTPGGNTDDTPGAAGTSMNDPMQGAGGDGMLPMENPDVMQMQPGDPVVPDVIADSHDVVIYGCTSAGVIAGVQAIQMGKSVVLVCPELHLGGLSAGGLGWTDSGDKSVIGGLSRNFYQRIKQKYDDPNAWVQQTSDQYSRYNPNEDAMWVFEPHVAEEVFEDLVTENSLEVYRDEWLNRENGVEMDGARILSITTLSGTQYPGKLFIDATYEGDLMAAAGVSYHVGRESNATYGETINGVQTARATSHQFSGKIDPYIVPGDPNSGLLPRISADPPGADGSADKRVQAYNYRMCLTNDASNRVAFPMPENYDPMQYELLLRTLLAGSDHVFGKFDPAPNHKTDTNNHGPFSTDNIGMNYDYPDATYEEREAILAEHRTYEMGYFYFLSNDPRVPDTIRSRMSSWGLSADEFVDTDNWPHQIYVREARRMVSDFVMTELHLRRTLPTPKPVGMGSYNMDSHNTQRYVAVDGDGVHYARNEGDIQISPGGAYPISYEAIIPKKAEVENLIVPVALSSSHIAYGSIRMEPVFMILGQSAATAASLALDGDIAVQDVDYGQLSTILLNDGQVIGEDTGPDPSDLEGIVMDDSEAILTGTWPTSSSITPMLAGAYRHDDNTGKGTKTARFELDLPQAGSYEVRVAYTASDNRATNVPVSVEHSGGTASATVNQRVVPTNDMFVVIGTYQFGTTAAVEISNTGTDGYVVVDGVQLIAQ